MPRLQAKMTSTFTSLVRKGTALLSGNDSYSDSRSSFPAAPEGKLFPKVDPVVDGEECLRDCETCTIHYPSKFSIDETAKLYGQVKGWSTHLLVATGKTDWVRDVADEKGSVMEAVDNCRVEPSNGRLMLSASNIPLPSRDHGPYDQPARVLLLPAFTWIDNVTPETVPKLIRHIIDASPTNTTPLNPPSSTSNGNGTALDFSSSQPAEDTAAAAAALTLPASLPFTTTRCQHSALILLCSQRTRDARCGQSAPLLRREFERHLRPLGLYRDLHDDRPGGVGIYFISHTGGHKFSANVMVYRRGGMRQGVADRENGGKEVGIQDVDDGAIQCIWLARVRPEECEGIIKYTVLEGKVVKPERQLRGGFDREKGLVSW